MDTPREPRNAPGINDSTATDNRRVSDRRESSANLLVEIQTMQFSGQADNLSPNGVFFFADEKIRVQVHVHEDGVEKSYTGKIVRVQQMNERECGFAIEFDRK